MAKNVWKRVLAFMLAFAMVVCDAGVSNLVYADTEEGTAVTASDEGTAEDEATTYLTETLKTAWDAGEYIVTLDTSYGVTSDILAEVYEDVLTHNYKYFYVNEGYSYSVISESGLVTEVYVIYGLDTGLCSYDSSESSVTKLPEDKMATVTSMLAELEDAVAEVVNGASSSWSEAEIALYLNDYLAANCQYDEYGYKNNNTTDRMKFTIYGALVENVCVCEGYARAFTMLATELGLEAELVRSINLGHEWNAVKIGDIWYMLDITWDDPTKGDPDEGGYCYFNEDGSVQINDTIGKAYHTYFLKSYDDFNTTASHIGVNSSSGEYENDWTYTGGLTASDFSASDDYFTDEFLDGVNVPFVYDSDNNVWYALYAVTDTDTSDGVDTSGTVYTCKFSGSSISRSALFTVNDTWHETDDDGNETSTVYLIGYYGFGYYSGVLYYTTSDSIYSYNLSSGETESHGLTDDEKTYGRIYGMRIESDGTDSTVTIQLIKNAYEAGTIVTNWMQLQATGLYKSLKDDVASITL